MTNQGEDGQVPGADDHAPGADDHIPTPGEISFRRFLEDQARALEYDAAEAFSTGRLYRTVHPEGPHGYWLWRRSLGFAGNPGPIPTRPLEDRREIEEELWHRTHISYFLEIFNSFLASSPDGALPVYRPDANRAAAAAEFPGFPHLRRVVGFTHDSLEWEALLEIIKIARDMRFDTIIHYHIPVDGAIFLRQVPGQAGRVVHRHGRPYHLIGPGNDVPQEFLDHARTFFGSTPQQFLYYCPEANRFELVYRVTSNLHGQQRKVDLKICFEPGWPTEPFDEEEWFETHTNRRLVQEPDM